MSALAGDRALSALAQPRQQALFSGLLAEVVPDGNKERTMLLGLTGNRDALAEAAAKSTATMDALTLFDLER